MKRSILGMSLYVMTAKPTAALLTRSAFQRTAKVSPLGMVGTFGAGRDPDILLKSGQALAAETLKIAQDVGWGAVARRTLVGQRALLDSSLELLRELPTVLSSSRAGGAKSAPTLLEALELPRRVLNGDAAALGSFLEALPRDLAPRTLRRLFERLGATYIKVCLSDSVAWWWVCVMVGVGF